MILVFNSSFELKTLRFILLSTSTVFTVESGTRSNLLKQNENRSICTLILKLSVNWRLVYYEL